MLLQSLVHLFAQVILLLLALDHIITGGVGLLSPEKSLIISKKLFGLDVKDTVTYRLLILPWASLGIFAGLVGLLPLFDPIRFKPILYFLVILLIFRVYYRIVFVTEAGKEFLLTKKRNIVHVALILVCIFGIVGEIIFL